jgi:hypothetical protein
MERPDDTIRTRARRTIVLCTLSIAASAIMTWPLVTGLNRLGRTANSGDAGYRSGTWLGGARALTDPGDLFDANIFHPHRNTLAFSEANLAAGVIGLPPGGSRAIRRPRTTSSSCSPCGLGRHDVAVRAAPDG